LGENKTESDSRLASRSAEATSGAADRLAQSSMFGAGITWGIRRCHGGHAVCPWRTGLL